MSDFVLHGQFDNSDEYTSAIRAWDMDVVQLGRGELNADVLMVQAGDMELIHTSTDKKLHRYGSTPEGRKTFTIAALPDVTYLSCGKILTADQIRIFPASLELEGVSFENFDVFTVSITTADLEKRLDDLGCQYVADATEKAHYLTPPPLAVSHLRDVLHGVSSLARSGSVEGKFQQVEEYVVSNLLSCLAKGTCGNSLPSFSRRAKGVRRAVCYIRDCVCESIPLSDLCREAGVSERTLHYGFKEILNTSPQAYIKAYKLRNVRQVLLSGIDTSVSQVAIQGGFLHLGQFSHDYKEQFGELLSCTLKRTALKPSLAVPPLKIG